jgi:hypothetical protein
MKRREHDRNRMKIKTALLVLAASASAVPALAQMPPAQGWDIGPWVRGRNYSVGMPAHPSAVPGGVSFAFPPAGQGQIDAMTTAVGPLVGARQITLRYRIEAPRGTRFVADETPNQPATVSLYLQQRGDNWSGTGRWASYRWYVPVAAVMPLASGERTVTVRLDDIWTDVNGRPNTENPSGFAAALANTSQIGIAFGSSSRRSHGVYTYGPARFTLLGLDVR